MEELFNKNQQAHEEYMSDRRGFLKNGLALSAALGFWLPSLSFAETPAEAINAGRAISFSNAHTGEKFNGEYWENGRYIPDAFQEIRKIMRDYRTDEICAIDPRLIDVLYVIQGKSRARDSFVLFSGYRSPRTNRMLRQMSEGVARGSLHMQGQAADINLPGINLEKLENMALALKMGGVGYYPKSGFVHIDTGRVRKWG